MKRILAVILAFCMILPALPTFAASKAAEQEVSKEKFKDEIIVSVKDAEKTGDWIESTAIKNFDGSGNLFAAKDNISKFSSGVRLTNSPVVPQTKKPSISEFNTKSSSFS